MTSPKPHPRRSRAHACHVLLAALALPATIACATLVACAASDEGKDEAPQPDIVPSIDGGADVGLDAPADAPALPCDVGHLCTIPMPLEAGYVTAIVGRSNRDVWASGTAGLLMHWDGDRWGAVDLERPDTLSSLFLTPDETWGVAGDLVLRANADPKQVRTTRLENGRRAQSLSILPSGAVYIGFGEESGSARDALARLDFDASSLAYVPAPVFPWGDEAKSLAFRAAFLIPDEVLWLVGEQGVVARYPRALLDGTGDPSARGVILPTTSRASLRAAWGYDEQLWTAGSQGTILHYDGKDWHTATSGTTATLNAVFGLSPADVWAAGDDGTVLHFDGEEWTAIDTGSYRGSLRAIWAATPDDVWIGGERILLHWGATR